jgi:hypothetical protein
MGRSPCTACAYALRARLHFSVDQEPLALWTLEKAADDQVEASIAFAVVAVLVNHARHPLMYGLDAGVFAASCIRRPGVTNLCLSHY